MSMEFLSEDKRCGDRNGKLVCVRYVGHGGGHFWGEQGMSQSDIERNLFSRMFPGVINPFAQAKAEIDAEAQ